MTCEHSALHFCELCADSKECVACKMAKEIDALASAIPLAEKNGEKRAVEGIVRWIAKRANGWTSVSIALAIERGEHREEGK